MEFAAFDPGNCRPYKYKDGISNGISFPYAPSGSRFSSKKIEGQDESRNHIPPSYCQSPLSHEFSLSREEPSCVNKVNETNIGGNLKKDSKSEETPSNSNQFHFSIYKWASKGVPLLMPLRRRNSSKSREMGKIDRCSSSNGRIQRDNAVCELPRANLCDFDSVFLNRSTPANILSCKMDGKKQDNDSLLKKCFQNILEPCQIVDEAVLAMLESQFLDSFERTVENLADDVTLSDERKEMKPLSLSKIGFCGKTEKENYVFIQEACKPDLKPLQSLFNGYSEKQGNNEITRNDEGKESTVKIIKVSNSNVDATENRKKYDVKRNNSNRAEVNKASLQGPPIKSGDTFGRNGVKGKVKEFVKIFNQDASSKPKMNADIRSRRSRWRGTGTYGADNEASVRTTGTDGKLQNKLKTLPDTSFMVDQNLEQLEKQHSQMKTIHKMSNNSSGQKDASASISESLLDCSKDTLGNIDDPNFLIKELSHDQDKLQQTGKDYEDIHISDVKIQQWSKGKEENIRSVLWPESGWKPVPLVDVIEGSAVKRAYQKALLCLHPDKLQQKGAASHQKYIAEKVFDILQGAWDHFNSLSSL